MRAVDLSATPCAAENNATVTVNVRRNEKSPVFEREGGLYEASVKEDLGENNRVTTVRARDNDSQVGKRSRFSEATRPKCFQSSLLVISF